MLRKKQETGDPGRPVRPPKRNRLTRTLLLALLAGVALFTAAPGASATQPTGHSRQSAPYASVAESRPRVVTGGGGQESPEPPDDSWISLLALVGLLVAAPLGYLAHTRREAA
ncbi:hypothetical protein ATK36_4667 [Amycolatopsis sulphurea]|uniref:MYXO-CTERM domain-containing protein n=1 Tax=Amycolatopsis sulphurea TaxID=76022 RepID=A0A2A9FGF6_9PSEU|nr:hypothetical protein ATK36_4667 [Amycolatopsis sulphurea]